MVRAPGGSARSGQGRGRPQPRLPAVPAGAGRHRDAPDRIYARTLLSHKAPCRDARIGILAGIDELCRITPTPRARGAKVALAALAGRQWGIATRAQLERRGVSATRVSRWAGDGTLHRVHPGVYAVGHRALSEPARLAAALLYAGPGAMLSHATAAWWWRLISAAPEEIHVSTSGRRRCTDEVIVHARRRLQSVTHARMPVTAVAQTLLDFAATGPAQSVRRAVAEAEYRRLVSLDAVAAEAGRGLPGSAALRSALVHHLPQLALTRSDLEDRFLGLCEDAEFPLPQVNASVCGLTVDAYWAAEGVVVELDGHAAHATATAVERDRRRELRLRAAGLSVLRYTWQQITEQRWRVVADLRAALDAAARSLRGAQ